MPYEVYEKIALFKELCSKIFKGFDYSIPMVFYQLKMFGLTSVSPMAFGPKLVEINKI